MGKLRHREVQGLAHLERNQTGLQEPFFFFFQTIRFISYLVRTSALSMRKQAPRTENMNKKNRKKGSKGLWDWALKWRLSEHPSLLPI